MSVIGLRVGPFEIVEPARVPEQGAWYLARRSGMTRKQPTEVLVRVLSPDATGDARAALQRQYESLREVEDDRIPSAVAFYEGVGALALTAATGTPLSEAVVGRGSGSIVMTPATLLDVALELAESLQHLHHNGRVHGHLSGDNAVIAPDGKLWLFGYGEGPTTRPSPQWIAPERARGEPAVPATDQWSLGAIAASLITGHPPWASPDPDAQSAEGNPADMVDPVERQWPALGRLIRRMMDNRPENRFPTMHPVRQELLALSRKAGGVSDRRELGALLARQAQKADEEAPASFAADVEPSVPVRPTVPDEPLDDMADAAPATPPTPELLDVPEPRVLTAPPSDAGEPDEADMPEPRAPVAPLPEEPLPVVRPDMVDGEVPVARRGEEGGGGSADPFDGHDEPLVEPSEVTQLYDASPLGAAAAALSAEVDKQRAEAETVPDAEKATDAINPFDPENLKTPLYADRQADGDEEDSADATVLFDSVALAQQAGVEGFEIAGMAGPVPAEVQHEPTDGDDTHPTLAPETDAVGTGPPSLGVAADRGQEPTLGDPADALPPPSPPASTAVLPIRIAQGAVVVMLLAMIAWYLFRVM